MSQDIKLTVDYDGNLGHLKILEKAKFNKTLSGASQTHVGWKFDVKDPALKSLINELTLYFPPTEIQMFTGLQQVPVPRKGPTGSGKFETTLAINPACPPGTYPYIVSCDLDGGENPQAMAERLGITLGELESELENQKHVKDKTQQTKVRVSVQGSPEHPLHQFGRQVIDGPNSHPDCVVGP